MEQALQAIREVPAPFRTDSLETDDWRVAACAVAGPGHHARGLGCDDSFAWQTRGQWLVACVSDGAGSAPHGAIGARIGARTVCDVAALLLPDDLATPDDQAAVEQAIAIGVGAARAAVERDARDRGAHPRQYHATLVGIVAKGTEALLFHIGDGAGLAFGRAAGDGATPTLSPPENGEFSNQTTFFTLPRWRDYLRFTRTGGFDMAALMTDGVTPFALDRGEQRPVAGFVDPICATLDKVAAPIGALALHALLDRPDVRAACDDDKTILWLARIGAAPVEADPSAAAPARRPKIDAVTYVLHRRRRCRRARRAASCG